jgi:hypothetical protein
MRSMSKAYIEIFYTAAALWEGKAGKGGIMRYLAENMVGIGRNKFHVL